MKAFCVVFGDIGPFKFQWSSGLNVADVEEWIRFSYHFEGGFLVNAKTEYILVAEQLIVSGETYRFSGFKGNWLTSCNICFLV